MRTVVLALVLLAVVGCEEPEGPSETVGAVPTLVRMPQTTPDNTPEAAQDAQVDALPTSDAGLAQEPAQADAGAAQAPDAGPSVTTTPVSTPAPVMTPSPVTTPAPVATPVPEVVTVKAFYNKRPIVIDAYNWNASPLQEVHLLVTITVGAGPNGTDLVEAYDTANRIALPSGNGGIEAWPAWSGGFGGVGGGSISEGANLLTLTFNADKQSIQAATLDSAKVTRGWEIQARFQTKA